MKYTLVASVIIPAMATPLGWVRSSKRFDISPATPVWQIRMLDEFIGGVK